MAETAAILSPTKRVLLPDLRAGCSLAATITAEDVRAWKAQFPGYISVGYVNTTADVKAELDYCCTSGNVLDVIDAIPADKGILFLPDFFLGAHVRRMRPNRKVEVWMGECHVHKGIRAETLNAARAEYPDAEVLVHPECGCAGQLIYEMGMGDVKPEGLHIASTEGMIRAVTERPASRFIIATETGIMHRMEQMAPSKQFIAGRPRGGVRVHEDHHAARRARLAAPRPIPHHGPRGDRQPGPRRHRPDGGPGPVTPDVPATGSRRPRWVRTASATSPRSSRCPPDSMPRGSSSTGAAAFSRATRSPTRWPRRATAASTGAPPDGRVLTARRHRGRDPRASSRGSSAPSAHCSTCFSAPAASRRSPGRTWTPSPACPAASSTRERPRPVSARSTSPRSSRAAARATVPTSRHEVMVKDNHWQALSRSGGSLAQALDDARELGITALQVEVESEAQLEEACRAGATRLLVDNQRPDTVRAWGDKARALRPGIEIEATGGITLENVRSYAEAGADFVSVGALTHSVKAADLALEVRW